MWICFQEIFYGLALSIMNMNDFLKRNFSVIVLILLAIGFCYTNYCKPSFMNNSTSILQNTSDVSQDIVDNRSNKASGENNIWNFINTDKVPSYVIDTLKYIRANNKTPYGFVWWTHFTNYEKVLPYWPYYTERDVKKHINGVNRGPERLVTTIKNAYYTSDHYKTFIQLQ